MAGQGFHCSSSAATVHKEHFGMRESLYAEQRAADAARSKCFVVHQHTSLLGFMRSVDNN